MAKYRGVLMVPSVIEFDSEGSDEHITEQARRIARSMGKAESCCTIDATYEPKIMEIKRVGDSAPPQEGSLVITPAVA